MWVALFCLLPNTKVISLTSTLKGGTQARGSAGQKIPENLNPQERLCTKCNGHSHSPKAPQTHTSTSKARAHAFHCAARLQLGQLVQLLQFRIARVHQHWGSACLEPTYLHGKLHINRGCVRDQRSACISVFLFVSVCRFMHTEEGQISL